MMTLEELWENLRQNPETKATMEEVDKSYKLFKKIENLIVADLEAKLAESENEIERLKSKEKKIRLHTKRDWFERCCRLEDKSISLGLENIDLKQQLENKEKEVEELKKGVYKVTLGTTPSNQIDFTENFYVIQNKTAIAELEKVVEFIKEYPHEPRYWDIASYIDQQIKSLKGEK